MKPGSYTQLYIQIVFAVKGRENLLTENIRNRVFEYVSGIISGLKHKSIIVNGVSDHIHIFFGLYPSMNISDTVHAIKRGSSLFINENKLTPRKFSWQEGYGAFSYSRSALDNVYRYIENQEKHHSKTSFKKEYTSLLEEYQIAYDPKFLFEFYDGKI